MALKLGGHYFGKHMTVAPDLTGPLSNLHRKCLFPRCTLQHHSVFLPLPLDLGFFFENTLQPKGSSVLKVTRFHATVIKKSDHAQY